MKKYARNIGLAKPVLEPKCRLSDPSRGIAFADLFNHLFGDFSHSVALSKLPAPLSDLISVIVGLRSEKQVAGIYTRWIVAVMQYAKALVERSVMQFVGVAMCTGGIARFGRIELAIAILVRAPAPFPTVPIRAKTRRLINLNPEAFKFRDLSALRRAKQIRVITAPYTKWISASLAKACYFESTQRENLQSRFELWLGSFVASIGGRAVVILT